MHDLLGFAPGKITVVEQFHSDDFGLASDRVKQ